MGFRGTRSCRALFFREVRAQFSGQKRTATQRAANRKVMLCQPLAQQQKETINCSKSNNWKASSAWMGFGLPKQTKKMAGGQGEAQSKDRAFGELGGSFLGSMPHLFL